MPKPPGAVGARTRTKYRKFIVPRSSARTQYLQAQSPKQLPLPQHLDELISLRWNHENSRRLDWWLWYCQQEFEMAGGAL